MKEALRLVAETANCLSDGDLIEVKIRSQSQWGLLPIQASIPVYHTTCTVSIVHVYHYTVLNCACEHSLRAFNCACAPFMRAL